MMKNLNVHIVLIKLKIILNIFVCVEKFIVVNFVKENKKFINAKIKNVSVVLIF